MTNANHMKTLKDIGNVNGKIALLRVDFNVPVEDGVVQDDFRIKSTLPTIDFLKKAGAKVCIIAHSEANVEGEKSSLRPAFGVLNNVMDSVFADTLDTAKTLLEKNDVVLVENLRTNVGEKANDETFAKELASLADFYVNEAFSVCHREHASIVGVPKFLPSYAGLQLEKEIYELSKVFKPAHPFVFILGGAKFETKLPLINKFIDKADFLCIGGALSNDLLKAQGKNVGVSKVSKTEIDLSAVISSKKLMGIVDVVVQNGENIETKDVDDVSDEDSIMDAGVETIKLWEEKIRDGAFILWNGPLGNFELGFDKGTLALASAVASSDAESIVGGGDTLSAIKKLNLESAFSFISTGGGATLDFLANETLPGIQALS
jgi:phosphoglycerate kinase